MQAGDHAPPRAETNKSDTCVFIRLWKQDWLRAIKALRASELHGCIADADITPDGGLLAGAMALAKK